MFMGYLYLPSLYGAYDLVQSTIMSGWRKTPLNLNRCKRSSRQDRSSIASQVNGQYTLGGCVKQVKRMMKP